MLDWRRRTENWSSNWDSCGRHISERWRGGGEEGRGKERMREMKGERGGWEGDEEHRGSGSRKGKGKERKWEGRRV